MVPTGRLPEPYFGVTTGVAPTRVAKRPQKSSTQTIILSIILFILVITFVVPQSKREWGTEIGETSVIGLEICVARVAAGYAVPKFYIFVACQRWHQEFMASGVNGSPSWRAKYMLEQARTNWVKAACRDNASLLRSPWYSTLRCCVTGDKDCGCLQL